MVLKCHMPQQDSMKGEWDASGANEYTKDTVIQLVKP